MTSGKIVNDYLQPINFSSEAAPCCVFKNLKQGTGYLLDLFKEYVRDERGEHKTREWKCSRLSGCEYNRLSRANPSVDLPVIPVTMPKRASLSWPVPLFQLIDFGSEQWSDSAS
jgi:hypothetical protein